MQKFANACKGRFILAASLMLALMLTVAMPAGAQDETADSVFISIRHYDGIDPADLTEAERITREGFVPLISRSDGFIAYYVIYPEDGTLAAINVFETREQALASNELAREFVVDYLAPLLPNPPLIIEGLVDIGFVAMLDGISDGDVSSLHGSVRLYDGFESEDRAEFVALVDGGFLPIMRETDGFFGYYLMNDGAEKVAALSIFDTEESALASNEKARDFVAENLTAFLPNDPVITSGRVGIAVLADLNDGANLIDDMTAADIFVSVRVYDGVDPADQREIARRTADGFLPIMRESDGFVGYYLLPAGEMLAAVSFFDSAAQAAASNAEARDFVAANLAPFLPNAPRIVEGTIDVEHVAGLGDASSLYASLRIYDNANVENRKEASDMVRAHLLPALIDAGGLFSYYTLNDHVDTVVALNVYHSEATALAANDLAAAYVAEYQAERLPDDPLRISGQLGVAAVAAVNMGENLVDDLKDEGVFASVRVYDGVDPADQREIARRTADGFLPIMRESDGFVGYYLLPAGEMLAAVSFFDSAAQAAASNAEARDFVAANLAPFLPNAPAIFEGPLAINTVAALPDSVEQAGGGELYASIRFYEGFDLSHFDEANALAIARLLPAMQELDGFFAQYALNDAVDTVVGISIFAGEESALAANDVGKAFTSEYLADWAPNAPTGLAGKLAIAALADMRMGENLVGAMTEG